MPSAHPPADLPLLDTHAPEPASGRREEQARSLVVELGEALERLGVRYCCEWKVNWKKHRWMAGEGDIDLLVERATEPQFTAVLEELGFRRATPPAGSRVAGMESCFGLDRATGRLIHVHVHYQLLTGGVSATNPRLPIQPAVPLTPPYLHTFPPPAPVNMTLAVACRMLQPGSGRGRSVW